jgi:chromosome segregation ATPase
LLVESRLAILGSIVSVIWSLRTIPDRLISGYSQLNEGRAAVTNNLLQKNEKPNEPSNLNKISLKLMSMWSLEISNIAGIRKANTALAPGTTAVQASNWQGKTSLILAIKTVLGASVGSETLTNGADSGYVQLQTRDDEYKRRLKRTDGSVTAEGNPYLAKEDQQAAAELFAFLDETNAVRTAVRESEDLTPLLIKPLKREDIEGQINELKSKRKNAEVELERANEAAEQLPTKIEDIKELETELSELRTELEKIEGKSSDAGEQEQLRTELKQARRQKEQVSQRINRLEGKISSLESQIDEKEHELESLTIPSQSNLSEKLDRNRSELREVDQEIETLEALYNATSTVLEGDHLDLLADIDRQIDDDYLSCWVCGSDTTRDTVENRMEEISDMIADRRDQRSELQDTVADLETTQNDIDRKRRQKSSLEESLDRLRTDLADSKDELAAANEQLAGHTERVETLETQVEESDDRRKSIEKQIAQKEAELKNLQNKRDSLEQRAEKRDRLEKEVEQFSDEIEALRSRRESVIQRARDAFDEALEDVVAKFNPSFEKARLEKHVDNSGRTTQLDLVIARDGREISVDALSEGEVELIGLIAALAGYEAFDVADQVPCILIDHLGALASEHIHMLVDYLEDRTEYLVTTAYPEAGEFEGNVISPADWDIVSDDIKQPT